MSISNWLSVYDNEQVLPDLGAVYDVFARIAIPPSVIWATGSEAVEDSIGLPVALAQVFGAVARSVLRLADLDPKDHDIECWSNRLFSVGDSVEYHVDNDEALRRETGRVRSPIVGSVLYVGGGGAGTWFRPPVPTCDADPRLFANPNFGELRREGGTYVPFSVGRLVIFDGRCPHCVAPFPVMPQPRVALLCNIWPAP